MKILIDSHLLVWLSAATARLPLDARKLIEDKEHRLFYSSASIWELTVKHSLGKNDIPVHPRVLHAALIENGFEELPVTSAHALTVGALPPVHKDPFDRILVAQSIAEGMLLLTSDEILAQYDAPIRFVR